LGVFIGQEIDRFNILYGLMTKTLDLLDRAIAGTVVMSQDLENMSVAFLNNKVPLSWEKVGYPSLKPLSSWTEDLIKRLDFLGKWLYEGTPDSFWLSAFFFPQGFMTASLQTYARKMAIPIDKLKFMTHVRNYGPDDPECEVPENGVNMYGLFIEGAKWEPSKLCLEDSVPREPIVEFPLIWLEPVSTDENIDQGCYSCPLYKTSTRRGELSTTGHSTNFVMYLNVPTETQPDYWIRRGTALLSMTND
jgi:dynein heavy chain